MSRTCHTACRGFNVVVPPSQLGLASCPRGTASATQAGYVLVHGAHEHGRPQQQRRPGRRTTSGLNGYTVHDKINGVTLDTAWDADYGPFKRLQFGSQHTEREKSQLDSSNDWTNGYQSVGNSIHDGRAAPCSACRTRSPRRAST